MNKTELIKAVAAGAQLTQAQAKAAVEATLDAIANSLKKEEAVALLGFGTFSVKERPAREGINPRNPDEKIQIAAKKVVKFKAGSQLQA